MLSLIDFQKLYAKVNPQNTTLTTYVCFNNQKMLLFHIDCIYAFHVFVRRIRLLFVHSNASAVTYGWYLLWYLCLLTERTHTAKQNKTSTSFALLGIFLSPLLPTLTLRVVKRSLSCKCIWDEFDSLTDAMNLSCGCVSIQNEMYTMRVINCCLLTNWLTFAVGGHLSTSDTGFLASRLSPNYAHFVERLVQEEKKK